MDKVLKKVLIPIFFVLFLCMLFSFVKSETTSCSSCDDASVTCVLLNGWNTGVAQADDEWYWFNCGGSSYNQLKIRATNGGKYSICKIENQEPEDCPTPSDLCVSEGEVLYFYQKVDEYHKILIHSESGDPGFEIELACSAGAPPATTIPISSWNDPRLGREGTISETTTPTYSQHKVSTNLLIYGAIVIVTISLLGLYKFVIIKKQK